ncbi:hypothetical protein QTN25_004079 [Entamoeba marina]
MSTTTTTQPDIQSETQTSSFAPNNSNRNSVTISYSADDTSDDFLRESFPLMLSRHDSIVIPQKLSTESCVIVGILLSLAVIDHTTIVYSILHHTISL